MKWECIIKSRYKGKVYVKGDIFPDDFIPSESWIKCGIVKEIKKTFSKKKEASNV